MTTMKQISFFTSMLLLFLVSSTVFAADETINYTYDALDRLIGVEYVGKGSVSYTYDKAGDITNLTILVVNSTFVDTDHDGIADDWEMTFWEDLTTASGTTDFDGDGYSDLWEYLNWKQFVFDTDGVVFSPILANSSGSPGYEGSTSFMLMVLPAILGGAQR